MKKSFGELTIVIVTMIAVGLVCLVATSFVGDGVEEVKDKLGNLFSNDGIAG